MRFALGRRSVTLGVTLGLVMSELGTWLIRAREARGLTLEDAERDTRISRRYLQALETEQYEVIPAPVYARGFLRSYSQYLGLDPQEMLELFPREDDGAYSQAAEANTPAQRPSREQPVSALGASRPTWRAQTPPAQVKPPSGRPPARRPEQAPPSRPPSQAREMPMEPMIGVDIGVPARRIKTDPAAQTRSAVIAIVAVGAILAVVLLAFLISNLGSADTPLGTEPGATATEDAESTAGANTPAPSGLAGIQRGIVPDLQGKTAEVAKLAIVEAGFRVDERSEKSSTVERGLVITQGPAGGVQWREGDLVFIVVSEGP